MRGWLAWMRGASLRRHIALWMFLASLVPVVALYAAYRIAETTIERETLVHLASMADDHTTEVEIYAEQKVTDVAAAAHEPAVTAALREFSAYAATHPRGSLSGDIDARWRPTLTTVIESRAYYDLLLVDRAGNVVFSVRRERDLGTNLREPALRDTPLGRSFDKAAFELTTEVSDFDWYEPSSAMAAFVAAPVLVDDHVIGAVVLQFDNHELRDIVRDYKGLGRTGETVIAARRGDEVVFVVPTRHDPNAALNIRRPLAASPQLASRHAIATPVGAGEAVDYRGHRVFAAWQYAPALRLGVVTKVDAPEILEPVTTIRNLLIATAALSVALLVAVMSLMTGSLASPLRALVAATHQFRVRDFTARIPESGPLEIATLGRALNAMASELHGSYAQLTHFNEKLETLVADRTKALHETEDRLHQAQKMEAIGTLAGGVAHDFNNLLSVILSYSDLIVDDLDPSNPMRAEVEEIKNAAVRGAELTRQLLAFSRRQVLQPKVLEVSAVVRGMEKMLRRVLREDIELEIVTNADPGRIHADPGQVEQVLMNLVVNARDALPRGGKIAIEAATCEVPADVAGAHGVSPGAYTVLSVRDDGIGMDDATIARIFEPFFTTKEMGKGTGLGLSTVLGIVQQSGGFVTVTSVAGKGTTMAVHLPRTDRALEAPVLRHARDDKRGNETILLVEDADAVRSLVREILVRNGYEVLTAQNGGEALLLCERREIHLLLSDVIMPLMSGKQLAARLVPLRPQMRVLLMSGYPDDALDGDDDGVRFAFLQKPVTPGALLAKVRDTLSAEPRTTVSVAPAATSATRLVRALPGPKDRLSPRRERVMD